MLFDSLLLIGAAIVVAIAYWLLIGRKKNMPEQADRPDGKGQALVEEPKATKPAEPTSFFLSLIHI